MAPEIYGIFENGLAYQYYPGVTLNVDTVLDANVWPLVAQQMAKMHKVELGPEVSTFVNFSICNSLILIFPSVLIFIYR